MYLDHSMKKKGGHTIANREKAFLKTIANHSQNTAKTCFIVLMMKAA